MTALASSRPAASPAAALRGLWRVSPPLVASAVAMAGLGVVCLVGLAVDPRVLGGQPVWVKPLKFCVSVGLYVLGLAVLMEPLRGRAVRGIVGWGVGGLLTVETVLVAVQAFRGVQSHFNTSTAFDGLLYAAMGAMIGLVWTLTLVAAIAVLRTPTADRLWKRAALWGLGLTLAGAAVGTRMTSPTPVQAAGFADAPPAVVGAHTVGAPDGGAGLPFVGWSRAGGDLRVPHFWGLHGLQALPLLALWLRRRRLGERQQSRLLALGGLAYTGVFVVLLQQALRGQPLLAPDAATLAASALLLTAAALAASRTLRPS